MYMIENRKALKSRWWYRLFRVLQFSLPIVFVLFMLGDAQLYRIGKFAWIFPQDPNYTNNVSRESFYVCWGKDRGSYESGARTECARRKEIFEEKYLSEFLPDEVDRTVSARVEGAMLSASAESSKICGEGSKSGSYQFQAWLDPQIEKHCQWFASLPKDERVFISNLNLVKGKETYQEESTETFKSRMFELGVSSIVIWVVGALLIELMFHIVLYVAFGKHKEDGEYLWWLCENGAQ